MQNILFKKNIGRSLFLTILILLCIVTLLFTHYNVVSGFLSGSTSTKTISLNMNRGWNMVSYLPAIPINIEATLSSIKDQILLVKNNFGETYIPAYGINDIIEMQPGQGYQICLTYGIIS